MSYINGECVKCGKHVQTNVRGAHTRWCNRQQENDPQETQQPTNRSQAKLHINGGRNLLQHAGGALDQFQRLATGNVLEIISSGPLALLQLVWLFFLTMLFSAHKTTQVLRNLLANLGLSKSLTRFPLNLLEYSLFILILQWVLQKTGLYAPACIFMHNYILPLPIYLTLTFIEEDYQPFMVFSFYQGFQSTVFAMIFMALQVSFGGNPLYQWIIQMANGQGFRCARLYILATGFVNSNFQKQLNLFASPLASKQGADIPYIKGTQDLLAHPWLDTQLCFTTNSRHAVHDLVHKYKEKVKKNLITSAEEPWFSDEGFYKWGAVKGVRGEGSTPAVDAKPAVPVFHLWIDSIGLLATAPFNRERD